MSRSEEIVEEVCGPSPVACECVCEDEDTKACDCDSMKVIDVTTEEGKKAYVEGIKNHIKDDYKRQVEANIKRELTKGAVEEAIKELGISKEEYDNEFEKDKERNFFRRHGYGDEPVASKETIEEYLKKIRLVRDEQDKILDQMCNKDDHILLDKNNLRNAAVTEYQKLENLKCRYLDIISGIFLGNCSNLNVVNHEGATFTKEL